MTENKTREWFWRDEFRTLLPDGRLIRNARIAQVWMRMTPSACAARDAARGDGHERLGLLRVI